MTLSQRDTNSRSSPSLVGNRDWGFGIFRLASAAVLLLAGALPAAAQNFKPKPCKIPQADIDKAIENGVNYLKSAGAPAGPWRGTTSEELVLYTLYHGGLPVSDPAFQQYLKQVVDRETQRTYSAALAAMCLSELDKAGYQAKL